MIKSIITFLIMIIGSLIFAQQDSGNHRFHRYGFHGGIGAVGSLNRFQLTAVHATNQYIEQKVDRSFSVLGNIFLGYGYTLSRGIFIGTEAGISIPKRTGEVIRQGVVFTGGNYTDHLSAHDVLTGDLLLGYELINRSLIYIRGGCSWAQLHIDQDSTPSIANSSFSDSAHKFGARIGLGVYYHLTDRLGISIDHVYTAYQAHTPLWKVYDLQFNQKVSSNYIQISTIIKIP